MTASTKSEKWLVLFPIFLREEPKSRNDIVTKAHHYGFLEGDDDHSFIYNTEAEAWGAAREFLEQARKQALTDISFLSRPMPGVVDDPEKLRQWQAEAREELRIAEAGLKFCPN